MKILHGRPRSLSWPKLLIDKNADGRSVSNSTYTQNIHTILTKKEN